MNTNWHDLIQRHVSGETTQDEQAALQQTLKTDASLRDLLVDYMNLDVALAASAEAHVMADTLPDTMVRHARVPSWKPWFSWRPLAAGMALGLFSASMVWAYAAPRAARMMEQALPLVNGDFESAIKPVANGIPKQFGVWSGDFARVAGAEEGTNPRSGTGMLRMLRSDSSVDAPEQDSHGGDLMQLVDLRPFKSDLASGNAVLEVSAACLVARLAEGQKFGFAVRTFAFSGSAEDLVGYPQDILQSALASGSKYLKLRGEAGVWKDCTARMLLPAEADFVMVKLTVTQVEPKQPGHAQFAGHYIDDVKLVLTTQPAQVTRVAKH